MEMDTWYDLRIEQLFDLTGRVNDLLDEVTDAREGAAPAPVQRVPQQSDLAGGVADRLEQAPGEN